MTTTAFKREPLIRRAELLTAPPPSRANLRDAIDIAVVRIARNIEAYAGRFPTPSSEHGAYPLIDNVEWTSGFWTGLLWMAGEETGDQRFLDAAQGHLPGYAARVENRTATDTHDLGFLYSLSCVAAYRIAGDPAAKTAALKAADLLLARYLPVAGIIQAWGDLNDPAQAGRMIIDCNLNLPLLYWASQTTGDGRYAEAANSHIRQAMTYLARPDASTFHTFFMDTQTGAPKEGKTHQGHSDTSCWSRGQAWGMCGFPLVYRYNRDPALIETAARLTNYFLNRLPDDLVCCWDLVFTDAASQRDSSAAAIAACGLLELARHLPLTDPDRPIYVAAATAMMENLIGSYACAEDEAGNGLLRHGVYHMPNQVGVDECCIWGDYFYFEALMRLTRVWEIYW